MFFSQPIARYVSGARSFSQTDGILPALSGAQAYVVSRHGERTPLVQPREGADSAEWLSLLPSTSDLQELGRGVVVPDRESWFSRDTAGSFGGQLTSVGVANLERTGAELRRLLVDECKVSF